MLWLLRRHVSAALCNLFGVLYPALMTAKAAKQKDEATYFVWLTYWTVWATLSVLEYSALEIGLRATLPFYPELKVLGIMWLVLPRFQGAAQVFDGFVLPWLLHYEDHIDESLEQVGNEVRDRASKAASSLAQSAGNYLAQHARGSSLQIFTGGDQQGLEQIGLGLAKGITSAAQDLLPKRDGDEDKQEGQSPPPKRVEKVVLVGGTLDEHGENSDDDFAAQDAKFLEPRSSRTSTSESTR